MRRAKAAGVTELGVGGEAGAERAGVRALYPSTGGGGEAGRLDCAWIHRERRRVGVTLQLLHLEYAEQQPDGCTATAILRALPTVAPSADGATMRQVQTTLA